MIFKDIDPALVKSLFNYKDGELFWKKNNKKAGSLKPTGYTVIEVNNKNMMAHRLIWMYHYGRVDNFIDHIDSNKSNNKIENLRLATKSQNCYNKKINPLNTTGCKGVRLRKDSGKYEARVTYNKKQIILGSFEDLELADLVAKEARNKYHKEFAHHG
jgi:hypothetical protein